MYLAQTSNTLDSQTPFYINIIEGIISKNNLQEKETIDTAIEEAVQVAKGSKEIFSISNSHYSFIITLLIKYSEKLKSLEGNNFDDDTYGEILEILK